MISDNCTLCDLTNILQWYESSSKDIQKSEQHKRTKLKIEGLRAIHEDSAEVLFGNLAEEEKHHPDISFGWGYCKIKIFTHAIKGLAESDFILAAKIDKIN